MRRCVRLVFLPCQADGKTTVPCPARSPGNSCRTTAPAPGALRSCAGAGASRAPPAAGPGAGSRGRALPPGVRGPPAADLGDGGHRDAPLPPSAQDRVPCGPSHGDALQRHLRAPAAGAAGHRQLQVGLAASPEAAAGDGGPGPEPASGDRGGGRGVRALPRRRRAGGRRGEGRGRPGRRRVGPDPHRRGRGSVGGRQSTPHPAEGSGRLRRRGAPWLHRRGGRAGRLGRHRRVERIHRPAGQPARAQGGRPTRS